MFILLDGGNHNQFACSNCSPPTESDVCVFVRYPGPTRVPKPGVRLVCPGGGAVGDCGPATADGTNKRWESKIQIWPSRQAEFRPLRMKRTALTSKRWPIHSRSAATACRSFVGRTGRESSNQGECYGNASNTYEKSAQCRNSEDSARNSRDAQTSTRALSLLTPQVYPADSGGRLDHVGCAPVRSWAK